MAASVAAFAVSGCARPAPRASLAAAEPRATGETVTISVVGTNDMHGRLARLPVFAGYVRNLRAARAADGGGVVLLDAGDMFQGTLESNLVEGASVVRAYAAIGYTAAAIGNHEFDFGPEGPAAVARDGQNPRGALEARARQAPFPLLTANVVDAATGHPWSPPNVRPSVLVDVAGVRVGIVGVTTTATPMSTLPSNFRGLAVQPLAPSIEREARALRARGATVVVVAAHAGASCARFDDPDDLGSCESPNAEIFTTARELPAALVDAIVGGHTHAGVAHRVAGIPIVEAMRNGVAFARVDLEVDRATGRVRSHRIFAPQRLCGRGRAPAADAPDDEASGCAASAYEGAPVERDPAVAAIVREDLARAQARRDEPVGVTITSPVRRSYRTESALGNLFADLIRAARPRADVALVNGGSLRTDLPAGPLRYGALYEALPFDNTFAFVELDGRGLASLLAHNLRRSNGIVSVSGVRADARCERGELVVRVVRDDGRAIRDDERVTVVTSNFLAEGGDGLFAGSKLRTTFEEEPPIREAMVDELRHRGGALAGDDPRLIDPARPRLAYPGPRPVRCGSGDVGD